MLEGLLVDTNKAIDAAGEWLKENPDFEPKFSRITNVVLNDDEATAAMTKEVLKRAGVDGSDPFFSMPHYAAGVMKKKAEFGA